MMKKDYVLVIGATTQEDRYAYLATNLLLEKGYNVLLFGRRAGNVNGVEIITEFGALKNHIQKENINIHTATLYVGPNNQGELLKQIQELSPNRIIFNPGTENYELFKELDEIKVEKEEACTLVLLNSDQF